MTTIHRIHWYMITFDPSLFECTTSLIRSDFLKHKYLMMIFYDQLSKIDIIQIEYVLCIYRPSNYSFLKRYCVNLRHKDDMIMMTAIASNKWRLNVKMKLIYTSSLICLHMKRWRARCEFIIYTEVNLSEVLNLFGRESLCYLTQMALQQSISAVLAVVKLWQNMYI